MRTIDKIILAALASGIWAVALSQVLPPREANAQFSEEGHDHASYEIYDFRSAVRRIVENCTVYVYDIDETEGYGSISC